MEDPRPSCRSCVTIAMRSCSGLPAVCSRCYPCVPAISLPLWRPVSVTASRWPMWLGDSRWVLCPAPCPWLTLYSPVADETPIPHFRWDAGPGQAPDKQQPPARAELPLDPAQPLGCGYQAGEGGVQTWCQHLQLPHPASWLGADLRR
jgi:hypothetical protein